MSATVANERRQICSGGRRTAQVLEFHDYSRLVMFMNLVRQLCVSEVRSECQGLERRRKLTAHRCYD